MKQFMGIFSLTILCVFTFAWLKEKDSAAKPITPPTETVHYFAITPTMKFNCLYSRMTPNGLELKKCRDVNKADLLVADFDKDYICAHGLCKEIK